MLEKAVAARKEKMVERTLSNEEQEVLQAYKEWKARKEGTKTLTESDKRAQKIAQIKAKIQENKARKERIQALREKIIAKKTAKTPEALTERVRSIRERIQSIKEEQLTDQFAPPLDKGEPVENQVPGMEQQPSAIEIDPMLKAEIQNVVSAAKALAASAGIEEEQPAEVASNIPAEVPAPGSAAPAPMSQMLPESKEEKRKALIEKIKARKAALKEEEAVANTETQSSEELVEATKARIQARREALKAIRDRVMDEGYEGITSGKENLSMMPSVPEVPESHLYNQKISGPDPSMPGKATLKAGKVWPTKPAQNKKTFEESDAEAKAEKEVKEVETKGADSQELNESDWSDRHIDRFLEKKELNFQDLLKNGNLG